MKPHLLALLVVTACTADTGTSSDTADPSESFEDVGVVSELWFERAQDGVSEGFDLDGVTSTAGGGTGCGVADFTGSDGTPGIDNSFAALLPALEAIGAEALEPLIQAAVDSGELLLVFEVGESNPDDGCVEVAVNRGLGEPTIGGLGRIVPGQTFDRHPDLPSSMISCAARDGTTVQGTPFELQLPLTVFDESIDLTLYEGTIKVSIREDGSMYGAVAGGISIAELEENVRSLDGVESDIINLATSALALRADLAPDETGTCSMMSFTLGFEAVSAYFFD